MSKNTNNQLWFRPIRNQNQKFSKKFPKKVSSKNNTIYFIRFCLLWRYHVNASIASTLWLTKGANKWLHQKYQWYFIIDQNFQHQKLPLILSFRYYKTFYRVADFFLGRPNHKWFILDFPQFFLSFFFLQTFGNVLFLRWQLFQIWNLKTQKSFS